MVGVENMRLDQVPTQDLHELLAREIRERFQFWQFDILTPKIQLPQTWAEGRDSLCFDQGAKM